MKRLDSDHHLNIPPELNLSTPQSESKQDTPMFANRAKMHTRFTEGLKRKRSRLNEITENLDSYEYQQSSENFADMVLQQRVNRQRELDREQSIVDLDDYLLND